MAAIEIKTGKIIKGHLTPKALSLVQEWTEIHKNDLLNMWETQEFRMISPLE